MHHFAFCDAAIDAEVSSVKAHFRSVLYLLRTRRPPGLDPAQKKVRALLLDELEAYADRGLFPKNRRFPGERRPTFVDDDGTRCAVAHLLELSGEGALAISVRDRMNFAPVSEIREDPRFGAWLAAAGFTREEIALVQPSYCEAKRSDCVCESFTSAGASLVSYQRKGWGYVVSEVLTPAPGLSVGQRLSMDEPLREEPEGTEYLGYVVPAADAGADPHRPYGLKSFVIVDGHAQGCTSEQVPLLTKEQMVAALLSPSPRACADYLASIDGDWEDGGCCSCDITMQSGSSSASLAVLAAVVAAIAARRGASGGRP